MGALLRNGRLFAASVAAYFAVMAVLAWSTPVAPSEAKLLFSPGYDPIALTARAIHAVWDGVFAIRLLPLGLGILNARLMWLLAGEYFPDPADRRFAFWIYLLVPGAIASSVLLNDATYAFTCVLVFLYAHRRGWFPLGIAALAAAFPTHTAVFAFYLGVAVYGWRKKEHRWLAVAALFAVLAVVFGDYPFHGRPRGHLIELFGVYMALFSPLFFIAYFYALYRISLEGPRDLVWTIASTALVVSLLLSVRQHILIVDFSPYLLPGVFLPVAVYLRSLRVRLPRFRRPYRIAAGVVVASMILSASVIVLHRPIYEALGRPERYFAAPLYRPLHTIETLRRTGKGCYPMTVPRRERPVYRFYRIPPCAASAR
ncbi:hypothetical protein [Nitratifractor sp.]